MNVQQAYGFMVIMMHVMIPRIQVFLSPAILFCRLIFIFWQELADHTVEVNVQHEVLDGMFTFYDITKAKLNIYQVPVYYFSGSGLGRGN